MMAREIQKIQGRLPVFRAKDQIATLYENVCELGNEARIVVYDQNESLA